MLTVTFITRQDAILTSGSASWPDLPDWPIPGRATNSRQEHWYPLAYWPQPYFWCTAATHEWEETTQDLVEQMTGRGGSHPPLGLWSVEQDSALLVRSVSSSTQSPSHLLGKKQWKKIPRPCPPLEKNSRKQNTTTSFYFVFFGNYTKDEKLIINISQSPPANSNYNRLNNKW